MGEPDLARNYSIRLRWMVLLSLLAFLPCSQVSVWLAVEQLDAVVDHQLAALHLDRLLRGHVDQLIGGPDLGLLARTFAQESTFPGVALQQIYEMLRPKFLKRDLEEQVVGVVAALYWPGSPYPPLASSSPGTKFIVNLFKFKQFSPTRLLALLPIIMLSSLVLWRPPLTKGPAPFGISPGPTDMPCCIMGLPTMADWMAMAGVTPVCLCCMAGVRAGVGGRLF